MGAGEKTGGWKDGDVTHHGGERGSARRAGRTSGSEVQVLDLHMETIPVVTH